MSNTLYLGTNALSDSEFLADMEACRVPNASFRHADHVRLAWILCTTMPPAEADERMCAIIQAFAARNGHAAKFHETMTRVWMRLVRAGLDITPGIADLDEFLFCHPWLLDKASPFRFYSRGVLLSDGARREWVGPDLHPLPPVGN